MASKGVSTARRAGVLLACFAGTAALLLGLLVLSALIPKETVAPQMRASAEYLEKDEYYAMHLEGVESTRIDRYADMILLNIAWHFDGTDPLRSVLEAKYLMRPDKSEREDMADAILQDLPANQQYLRYWHGSAGVLRAEMTFLSLPQIYLLHGVILAALAGWLLFRLIRRKAWGFAAGILAGLIGCACWLVPMSLEYSWVFLILLTQLHLILNRKFPKEWEKRSIFFLISGMVTNYLDFLTCETLTLLIPLMLMIWLEKEKGLPGWKTLLRMGLAWAIGYGGMYLLKWGLAAAVMGENTLPYVTGHVEQRLTGAIEQMSFLQEHLWAILRNVKCIFPLDYGLIGALAGILLLLAAGYIGYVHRRKGYDRRRIRVWAALGAIPYLRFLALANHSYLHFFFTYRAQFATLVAAALILGELTGWGEKKGSSAP